jgi:hypothetical protein
MIWTHCARAAAKGSSPASAAPPELEPEELLLEVEPELELAPELEVLLPEELVLLPVPPELEVLPEVVLPPLDVEPDDEPPLLLPLLEVPPAGGPPLPSGGVGVAVELHAAPEPIKRSKEAAATSLEAALFMGTLPTGFAAPL